MSWALIFIFPMICGHMAGKRMFGSVFLQAYLTTITFIRRKMNRIQMILGTPQVPESFATHITRDSPLWVARCVLISQLCYWLSWQKAWKVNNTVYISAGLVIFTDMTCEGIFGLKRFLTERTIIVKLRGDMDCLHVSSQGGYVPGPFSTQTASVSSCIWLNRILSGQLLQCQSSCNTGWSQVS